jgi:hypothetical protein
MHKGYKCLDRSTGWIFISYDVIFNESVFPYATPGVTVDVSTLEEIISFPSTEPATSVPMRNYDLTYLSIDASASISHVQESAYPPTDVHGLDSCAAGPAMQSTSTAEPRMAPPAADSALRPAAEPLSPASTSSDSRLLAGPPVADGLLDSPPSPPGLVDAVAFEGASLSSSPGTLPQPGQAHPMVTHTRDSTWRPKEYTDGTIQYNPARRAFFAMPLSHRDALDEPAWRAAMTDEFDALQRTNT